MIFKGHTTFSGKAYFSDVVLSGNKRPYIYIDIVYEGDAKDGGDISVGFVLSGQQVYQVAEVVGSKGEGIVFMTGRICTRTFKKSDKEKTQTGIEVSIFGVSPASGGEITSIESIDFLMFR